MKHKRCLIILAIVFGIALGLGGCLYYRAAINRKNSDSDGAVHLTVEPGQGVSDIANDLYAKRLIGSPLIFKVFVKLNNISSDLQAGEYVIPQNLSIEEVAEVLQKGVFEKHLTFIEGWRREEMASYLVDQMGEEFARYFLTASEGKEGYLFPDTYFVALDFEAPGLVERLTQNFEDKISSVATRSNLSNDLVILASIVEREALFPEDRPIVAGILWKRYQNGWPLEADATVQYAISEARCRGSEIRCMIDKNFNYWPKEITNSDLEIDSPYNTRKYAGLPPTPICNPGLESLEAALNHQATSYWFYVSDSEGHMHYAETIEEHNENVARVVY